MREFPRGTTQDAQPYIALIRSFTEGQITAQQFEERYLRLSKSEEKLLPKAVSKPINEVFYSVDEYVSDPDLRARAGGIDDDQLKEDAAAALAALVSAVENQDD